MKIYQDYKDIHTVYVQPGNDVKECSEFFDSKGNALMINVIFKHGCAEVSDSVGKYMIDHNMARATRITTERYKFAHQEKSQGNVICPECGTFQPSPSEETKYICENYECRRDFIRFPVRAAAVSSQGNYGLGQMLAQ